MALPESTRMRALRNLSAQLPVANQQVAAGQQAARDIQVQQAVAKAPAAAPITSTAQSTGAAVAQTAGEQAVKQAQQTSQQAGQIGQLGLQEQGQQLQGQQASQQLGLNEQKMDNVTRLAKLDENLKQELFDQNMTFQKDEVGRTIFNDRQLSDFTRMNAKSDEQYKNYAQQATQLAQRKAEAMEQAYKLVAADLDQKYEVAKQKGDQQTQIDIYKMKLQMQQDMQKAKNKAANTAAMWNAGGTLAGGAIGAIGGPVGAAAGAGIGGAVGGMIGGMGGL